MSVVDQDPGGPPPATATSLSGGNVIVVDDVSDLPLASGGVRTLADGIAYHPRSIIDLGTDVFAMAGDCTIYGAASSVSGFTTNSASPLISGSGSLTAHDVCLINTGGKVLALTTGSGKGVHLDSVDVSNAAADTFAGTTAKEIGIHGCHWEGTEGFIVSGAWVDLDITTTVWRDLGSTATMLSVASGATFTLFIIDDCFFITDAAGQTGLSIAAAVLPTAEGEVRGCAFTGAGTYPGGAIDQTTVGWWFSGNPGIEDSAAIGELAFTGNAVATVITDGTSWHAIAPGWTLGASVERFDEPSDGQMRYTGKEAKRFQVNVGMTVESAGNGKTANIRARKYDASATTTSTIATGDIDIRTATQPVFQARFFVAPLEQNDYIFFEIGSGDGTDMTVIDATMSVHVA